MLLMKAQRAAGAGMYAGGEATAGSEDEGVDDGGASDDGADDDGASDDAGDGDSDEAWGEGGGASGSAGAGEGARRRRAKALAASVTDAGVRGCRCPVCAQPFVVDLYVDAAQALAGVPDASKGGVRRQESEWLAAVAVKCTDCGAVAHAGCVGLTPTSVEHALGQLDGSRDGVRQGWRCQPCDVQHQQLTHAPVAGSMGAPALASSAPTTAVAPVRSQAVCCLCPAVPAAADGAPRCPLVRVEAAPGAPRVTTPAGGLLWAHMSCALWCAGLVVPNGLGPTATVHLPPSAVVLPDGSVALGGGAGEAARAGPGPAFGEGEGVGAGAGAGADPPGATETKGPRCRVCRARAGVMLQVKCTKGECEEWVHPSCVLPGGLYVEHLKPSWEKHAAPRGSATVVYCR
jgi:hypothetical protein